MGRGQSLVEFALILPIFMALLLGVVEFGRSAYIDNVLSQAAREAARLAAVEARWIGDTEISCVASPGLITSSNPGAHVCPATTTAFHSDVVGAASRMAAGLGTLTGVNISCDAKDATAPTGAWTNATVAHPDCGVGAAPNRTGDQVSVRITYQYSPIIPLLGSSVRSSSATMVIY